MWENLSLLVHNPTKVSTRVQVLWADPPSTIGCLCIAFLAIQALKDPSGVKDQIENLLPFLLNSIKSGTDDSRENSLILLYAFMPILNDKDAHFLVENKVFNALVRFFMCSKPEMRMMCAGICSAIYTGRYFAQIAFANEKGPAQLIKLIQWSSGNPENLSALLVYLEGLLVSENDQRSSDLCVVSQEFMAWDVLRDLKQKNNDPVIDEQLGHLITILMHS